MKNLSEHAQNVIMTTRTKNKILTLKIMTRYQDEKKANKKTQEQNQEKKFDVDERQSQKQSKKKKIEF
jgi:hypothetical protein